MRTLILCLLCSLSLHAADAPLLPVDVQSALADYEAKVAKAKADLVVKLTKAQDVATKKGDLDLALVLKGKVAEYAPKEGAEKPKESPQAIKKRLAGKFNFTLPNGHSGPLEVTGSDATDVPSGTHGDVRIVDDTVTIFWSNNTQWHVIMKDDALTVQNAEGSAPLILVEPKKH